MKKLLALVLALVMTLSLCVTSNAAYKDAADVDLDEAVDVLTAVGVFQGDENGNMNPKANLTREQAAKLVAYLQIGQKAADALVGGGKFADVAKTAWSAGYVDYCASIGIAAGVGGGKFDPTGSLTALQFGKMLLVCLGYDAASEGMVGADWQINTSKLMASANLLKGLDDVTANSVVTREQAAQMMLNALKAPMVEYDTKSTSISVNGADIVFGGSKASYVTTTVAKEQTISDDELTNWGGYTIELGEKLFPKLVLVSDGEDEFMNPNHTWNFKSKKVGSYADAEDLTYTAAVKLGTIYADLGLSKAIPGTNIEAYLDGQAVDGDWATYLADGIVKGDGHKIGGNGVLTTVYYDADDNSAIITMVNTYFGEIAATYATTSTKDAYVTLKTGATNTGIGSEFETDDTYAVGDKVLYTYSRKVGDVGVQSMKVAEKVTGTLEAYTVGSNVVVAGTTYKANDVANSEATITAGLSNAVKTDVTVYLDDYGYAVYVDASAASDAYAVVLGFDGTTGGAGTLASAKKADLLFLDGTRKTVDVKADKPFNAGGSANSSDNIATFDIVSYRINSDGEYVVTEVASYDDAADDTALVTKGNTTMGNAKYNVDQNAAGTNGKKANGKTVFLFWDTVNKTVSRYVGIANVPTLTTKTSSSAAVETVYLATDAAAAKVVFVATGAGDSLKGVSKDILFVKGSSTSTEKYNSDLGTYWEYDAILNGEIVKVQTSSKVSYKTLADNFSKNTKDVITITAGYFADNSSSPNTSDDSNLVYAAADADHKNDALVNGTVTLAGEAISVADNVKVFTIDANGDIAASTINAVQLDANDKVWYKLNSDDEVEFIVLEVVDDITPVPGTVVTDAYTTVVNTAAATVTITFAETLAADPSEAAIKTIAGTALQQAGYTVTQWNGTYAAPTSPVTDTELNVRAFNGALSIEFDVHAVYTVD